MNARLRTAALAIYFTTVQFYTSLQALSPTPQFGFTFVGRRGAIVLAALTVLCGVIALADVVRMRTLSWRSTFDGIALAWLGATLLASLLGFAPLDGLQVCAMMLLAGAFGVTLVRHAGEAGVVRAVFATYLIAGTAASLAGIAMVLLRVPRALYASSYGRAAGFFVTSNQFAAFAELFAFAALGVALGARSQRMRMLGVAGAASGFAALAATFSREAWLGAAVAAAFAAFALGRRQIAGALTAITLVAAVVVVAHPPPHHDPSDSFSRLRTLDAGVRVAQLFALTGVGPVAYWRVYPAIAPVNAAPPGTFGALHPHDVYVSIATELGLVGLFAVCWGFVRFARATAVLVRAQPLRARAVPLGVCAGLVAAGVSGLFDTIGVVQMTFVWLPYIALALASAAPGAQL